MESVVESVSKMVVYLPRDCCVNRLGNQWFNVSPVRRVRLYPRVRRLIAVPEAIVLGCGAWAYRSAPALYYWCNIAAVNCVCAAKLCTAHRLMRQGFWF